MTSCNLYQKHSVDDVKGQLEEQKHGNTDEKHLVQGLVPEEYHSTQSTESTTEERRQQQDKLWNSCFLINRKMLVPTVKCKRQETHYIYDQQIWVNKIIFIHIHTVGIRNIESKDIRIRASF